MSEVIKSTKSSNKINHPGDVEIKSALVITENNSGLVYHDISNHIIQIELYENLFGGFITGHIMVVDNLNIENLFPFIGKEMIDLEFVTPGVDESNSYHKTFFIYKVSDKQIINKRSSSYILSFISVDGMLNKNVKISKTFKGNPTSMISDILTHYLKSDGTTNSVLETTSNNFTFISNWWSPFKCIRYICNHALNENNFPDMLFFENRRGSQFASLTSLYNQPSTQKFILSDQTQFVSNIRSDVSTSVDNNIQADYQSILQISIHNGFDYNERIDSGYYNTNIVSYDTTTHQYLDNNVYETWDGDNYPKLNPYPPYPNSINLGRTSNLLYKSSAYQNFDDSDWNVDSRIVSSRHAVFSRLFTTSLTIKVYGWSGYSIGQIVEVLIPNTSQINTTHQRDKWDKITSGFYLVTAVNHVVSSGSHYCVLELAKDGYQVDLNQYSVPNIRK